MKRCVFIVFAAVLISLPAVADPLVLGRFSAGDIDGWQVREFEGHTRYRIVEIEGRKVLEADSDSSASSLYLEREIDLSETPVLEWSWRVEKPPGVTDERTKGRRRRLCRPGLCRGAHQEREFSEFRLASAMSGRGRPGSANSGPTRSPRG